jgi:CDP-glucose 4,6-dehydratase
MGFWTDRNVFVTGATGLLGSWLTEELLARGARVVCLIRDAVPDSRLVRSGTIDRVGIVRGELEDYQTLLRAINEYEVDTVFHLGAQTVVGTAARSAASTFESNIRGTWNLLEACRVCTRLVTRVIVASSDKAYGVHERLPYTEDTPLQGRFPYDVSKSCADLIAFSYFHTYGLPVAITRCGNLFGGGDLNFNRLVPGTIRSVLSGEPPIVRSDGTLVREYFYVEDAVAAYLGLAEQVVAAQLVGQAFNFGSEQPIAAIDMVRLLLRIMRRPDLEPEIMNEATHEIRVQYLDCSKARRVLQWKPRLSLEEGLARTVAWYAAYFEERRGAAEPVPGRGRP